MLSFAVYRDSVQLGLHEIYFKYLQLGE